MDHPVPDGYKGGGKNFGFVNTYDGHLGINVETEDDDLITNNDNIRANERSFGDASFGG